MTNSCSTFYISHPISIRHGQLGYSNRKEIIDYFLDLKQKGGDTYVFDKYKCNGPINNYTLVNYIKLNKIPPKYIQIGKIIDNTNISDENDIINFLKEKQSMKTNDTWSKVDKTTKILKLNEFIDEFTKLQNSGDLSLI